MSGIMKAHHHIYSVVNVHESHPCFRTSIVLYRASRLLIYSSHHGFNWRHPSWTPCWRIRRAELLLFGAMAFYTNMYNIYFHEGLATKFPPLSALARRKRICRNLALCPVTSGVFWSHISSSSLSDPCNSSFFCLERFCSSRNIWGAIWSSLDGAYVPVIKDSEGIVQNIEWCNTGESCTRIDSDYDPWSSSPKVLWCGIECIFAVRTCHHQVYLFTVGPYQTHTGHDLHPSLPNLRCSDSAQYPFGIRKAEKKWRSTHPALIMALRRTRSSEDGVHTISMAGEPHTL